MSQENYGEEPDYQKQDDLRGDLDKCQQYLYQKKNDSGDIQQTNNSNNSDKELLNTGQQNENHENQGFGVGTGEIYKTQIVLTGQQKEHIIGTLNKLYEHYKGNCNYKDLLELEQQTNQHLKEEIKNYQAFLSTSLIPIEFQTEEQLITEDKIKKIWDEIQIQQHGVPQDIIVKLKTNQQSYFNLDQLTQYQEDQGKKEQNLSKNENKEIKASFTEGQRKYIYQKLPKIKGYFSQILLHLKEITQKVEEKKIGNQLQTFKEFFTTVNDLLINLDESDDLIRLIKTQYEHLKNSYGEAKVTL